MIRLRELREKRGLSMKDAADLLNMPYTTYVNYEKGTREPNIEALFRLADFFEVTIDELLERCAPNEPLTLDELREMDGEPVWVEDVKHWALIDIEKGGQWDGVPFAIWAENGMKFTYNIKNRGLHCYRRPPDGEKEKIFNE